MSPVNRSTILQYEISSFVSYCTHLGLDPHEMAAFWIQKKKRNVSELNELARNALGRTAPQATLNIPDDTIESLIGLHRTFVEENCQILVEDISRFGSRFPQAIEFACKNSKNPAEQRRKWSAAVLNSIPVMLSYDFSFEASVNVIDQVIHFNKVIELIVDGIVAPVLANTLFSPACAFESVMMYDPSSAIACDAEPTTEVLVTLARNVAQYKDSIPDISPDLLSKSPAYLGFGFPLYKSILEFILLHEYSHVLLGHEPSVVRKTDEVGADILALNILLHKGSHFCAPNLTPGMEVALAARALGPIVLMMFLASVNIADGLKDSKSHPHPLVRAGYLKSIIPHFLAVNDRAVMVFDAICHHVESMFERAHALLGIPKRPYDVIDASFMNNVEFMMIDN